MYLADCERVLLEDIAQPKATRRIVARTYRMAMESWKDCGEKIDWGKVNRAIISRWSIATLIWIKNEAWSGECFEQRTS